MSGLCSLLPDTRSQRRVREYVCMVFAAPTGSRAPCGGSQFDMGRPGLPATNSPVLSPAAYGRAARPEKRRFALSSDLPLSGQSTDRPINRPRVRASKSDAELSCGEKLTGPPLSQHESFLRPNPGGGGGGRRRWLRFRNTQFHFHFFAHYTYFFPPLKLWTGPTQAGRGRGKAERAW